MLCYYYDKKRSGLFDYQDHRPSSKNEKRNVKIENKDYVKKKNKYLEYAEIKIRAEFDKKRHTVKERVDKEFDLHEIRQVIYAKLNHGMHVDSLFRTFEIKVEQYLRKYRRWISDFQEKTWKDKIIITEKAVVRSKLKGFKTRVKVPASYEDEVNTVVEDMKDEAQVYEVGAENHTELPAEKADDEERNLIKMKLPKRKRRRKSKVKSEDERRRRKFENLDMDELLGKNLVMPKYMKDEVDEENSILAMNEESTEDFDEKCDNQNGVVEKTKIKVKEEISHDIKEDETFEDAFVKVDWPDPTDRPPSLV